MTRSYVPGPSHSEKKETPQMEAREHSPKFLRKAERMARRKVSKRR